MSVEEKDTPNLTFVGGRAVEQHESADSQLDPDSRAGAIEAVKKAIEKAKKEEAAEEAEVEGKPDPKGEPKPKPKKAKEKPAKAPGNREAVSEQASGKSDPSDTDEPGTPERGPDGKFLPKEGKEPSQKAEEEPEDEEVDVDKATVKQLLKARGQVANAKREGREAKDEVSKLRSEIQQQQQETQKQWARFNQEQEAFKRQQESFQALKSDPARAIREVGWDPEQFIVDLAQEGTPEGKLARRQREIDDQLSELREWKQSQAKAAQEYQRRQQQQHVENQRQTVVGEFTKLGLDESKYPHIANFYEGDVRALVAKGDIVAQEYRRLSGGKEGSLPDILDYIEDHLAERASKWYTKSGKGVTQQVESTPTAKPTGKSLSPSQSGERRSMEAKTDTGLDDDERKKRAKQAVKQATQNVPYRTYD